MVTCCTITIIYGISQQNCTYNDNLIPRMPEIPENAVLVDGGDIDYYGYRRFLTTEYVISGVTHEELIEFFSNTISRPNPANVYSRYGDGICYVYPESTTDYAVCSGINNDTGSHYIRIKPTGEVAQSTTFTVMLKWHRCVDGFYLDEGIDYRY